MVLTRGLPVYHFNWYAVYFKTHYNVTKGSLFSSSEKNNLGNLTNPCISNNCIHNVFPWQVYLLYMMIYMEKNQTCKVFVIFWYFMNNDYFNFRPFIAQWCLITTQKLMKISIFQTWWPQNWKRNKAARTTFLIHLRLIQIAMVRFLSSQTNDLDNCRGTLQYCICHGSFSFSWQKVFKLISEASYLLDRQFLYMWNFAAKYLQWSCSFIKLLLYLSCQFQNIDCHIRHSKPPPPNRYNSK